MNNKFKIINKKKIVSHRMKGFTHTLSLALRSFLGKFTSPFFKTRKKIPNLVCGFTLIETMIALTIITFAILGPISLATYSIRASSLAKNQVIASFLAQDAMEYIKNWRDDNYLSGAPSWLTGLGGPCSVSPGCKVDTTVPYSSGTAITNCGGGCSALKYDGLSYNHSTGADTIFTREFIMKEIIGQEAEVSITISWEDRFGPRSFVLEDHIFNWHP